jgi:hypothetical protein
LILFFRRVPFGPKSQVFANPPYIPDPWYTNPLCSANLEMVSSDGVRYNISNMDYNLLLTGVIFLF